MNEAARPNDLRFPFNIRPLVALWNLLFLENKRFEPDATKSAKWNEGAYYVEGLGHCGACHSPRNMLGAVRASAKLAGGDVDGWYAPGLGARATAPVAWTKESLLNYLIDGWDERHGVAAGPMTAVVNHLAKLDEAMVEAMVEYLLDGQPQQSQGEREKTHRCGARTRVFGTCGGRDARGCRSAGRRDIRPRVRQLPQARRADDAARAWRRLERAHAGKPDRDRPEWHTTAVRRA